MAKRRSKTPLFLVMAGGIAFALGYKTLGLVVSGLGVILFAIGFGSTDSSVDTAP